MALACVLGLAACGAGDDDAESRTATDGGSEVAGRLDEIREAVDEWAVAASSEEAHVAAVNAINLVPGPNGPFSGDLDGDGTVGGESDVGVLSGVDGTPAGLATEFDSNPCVMRDVLGSTASDATAGWAETHAAIDAWRPDANTMPTLASHPMRIISWATFTLESVDRGEAHEDAGHAQLHVVVSRAAGLGGRPQRSGSPTEKARLKLTRTIRHAIDEVASRAPKLAAHLDQSILTGVSCCYDRAVDIAWTT